MTTDYTPPIDRDEDVDNVVECIEDLAELEWKFPVGAIMDSADLPQEVRDGLKKLNEVAGFLCYEAPGLLWEFVKAKGIADEVGARLERTPYATTDPRSAYGPLVRDLIWHWKQDSK
jgi:hypothetical protein